MGRFAGMTHTEIKLSEAKYFLEQMKQHIDSPEEFVYNLSAFLSAARSVTFIMQNEFSKIPEFREWYGCKQKKMENNELFRFFNGLRVAVIHKKVVIPNRNVKIEFTETITVGDSIVVEVRDKDGNLLQRYESDFQPESSVENEHEDVKTEVYWYFDEKPESDVITLCTRYIEELELLVKECIEKFKKDKVETTH